MKPSIPKGTRDFGPADMLKRNYIFDTIRSIFRTYGFDQIETPAMENLSMLEGKYGEEGDKLLFRILNSGPVLEKIREGKNDLKQGDVTEKGLRYDLTVPFARYVVMHQNEIAFPFRRYQIQPVWRADRPQKGRYREFFQCDADIIGSDSLFNEADLVSIIRDVFLRLRLGVSIHINNRKILAGISEVIGERERIVDITVALDKMDKIGIEKVNEELAVKGISENAIIRLQPIIRMHGSNADKLEQLKEVLKNSTPGMKGVEEMETLFGILDQIHPEANEHSYPANIELDITLARGLNYYTGAIIEVKVADQRSQFTSSICGGGRYDDLTGIFGLPGVSGVGISFGADRISDILDEINGFPDFTTESTRVLFANFGNEEAVFALKMVNRLRDEGISAELFPDAAKMKKQFGYADGRKIPYMVMIGSEEMKTGQFTLKNMESGEQSHVAWDELLHVLK